MTIHIAHMLTFGKSLDGIVPPGHSISYAMQEGLQVHAGKENGDMNASLPPIRFAWWLNSLCPPSPPFLKPPAAPRAMWKLVSRNPARRRVGLNRCRITHRATLTLPSGRCSMSTERLVILLAARDPGVSFLRHGALLLCSFPCQKGGMGRGRGFKLL